MGERILDVKNLKINFHTYAGDVKAIRDVSFHLDKGETLAIVGESGSGKSITTKSLMGLLANNAEVVGGSIMYRGEDLLKKTEKEMQEIRGKDIAMIFQDRTTSLDPTMKIGRQIAEPLMIHKNVDKKKAWSQALEILKLVGIANAEERINEEMQRIAEQEQTKLELRKAIAEENSAEMLELQLEELELQQQAELENTILNEEEKYLIVEKYEKLKQALVAETAKKNEEQATQMKMQLSASLQMMAKNASSAFGQMSELLEGYGEENEKASKAAKAFALMQLATDQAISISQTARAMVEAVQGATQAAASTGNSDTAS